MWLDGRSPVRPDSLAMHMMLSVRDCPVDVIEQAPTMADALGALGVAALAAVTAGDATEPDKALHLLAADAFVTYAFEAAADDDVSIQPLVARLLREVA